MVSRLKAPHMRNRETLQLYLKISSIFEVGVLIANIDVDIGQHARRDGHGPIGELFSIPIERN